MIWFGKHLPLKMLPIDTARNRYPVGVVTLKNRTLSAVARVFIERARELAKSLRVN